MERKKEAGAEQRASSIGGESAGQPAPVGLPPSRASVLTLLDSGSERKSGTALRCLDVHPDSLVTLIPQGVKDEPPGTASGPGMR